MFRVREPSNNGIEQTNGEPQKRDAVRSSSQRYAGPNDIWLTDHPIRPVHIRKGPQPMCIWLDRHGFFMTKTTFL